MIRSLLLVPALALGAAETIVWKAADGLPSIPKLLNQATIAPATVDGRTVVAIELTGTGWSSCIFAWANWNPNKAGPDLATQKSLVLTYKPMPKAQTQTLRVKAVGKQAGKETKLVELPTEDAAFVTTAIPLASMLPDGDVSKLGGPFMAVWFGSETKAVAKEAGIWLESIAVSDE